MLVRNFIVVCVACTFAMSCVGSRTSTSSAIKVSADGSNAAEPAVAALPNGDTLVVSRMDISTPARNMKMLTIQLMNPKKMGDFVKKMK